MAIRRCTVRERPKRHRTVISLTLDPHIVTSLKKEMQRFDETNFSNFVEGIFECFLRDTCEGCASWDALPGEEKERIKNKIGAGKWVSD